MRALPGQESRAPRGPKPPARKDAAIEQRRRILRVTVDLIAKRGYSDTTTELIVRRAKVGYGTFYKFFPDKEAAFIAVIDDAYELARDLVETAYAAGPASKPWAERLGDAIRAFYEAIASDPSLWRACLVESLTAGPEILRRYEGVVQGLGALLKPGREESREAAELPETIEATLAGGVVWIAYQRLIVAEAVDRLPGIVPEAVQFAVSPYLGEDAAVAVAKRYAIPG